MAWVFIDLQGNFGVMNVERDIVVKMEPKRVMAANDYFRMVQEFVMRRNKSGCYCIIDDDNVVFVCDAHKKWLEKELEKRLKSLTKEAL